MTRGRKRRMRGAQAVDKGADKAVVEVECAWAFPEWAAALGAADGGAAAETKATKTARGCKT